MEKQMKQSLIVEGGSGRSEIMIGESLDRLADYLPDGRTIIITDENVARHYRDRFPACDVITIGLGEKHKTLATIESIFEQLIALEADGVLYLAA